YFVFDNEAYMNTGIQRSGSSPQFVWTTSTLGGKAEKKKDLPRIMAAHEIPYVATLSLAFPEDFVAKVQKAQNMEPGFKYLHIHSPCPTGWRFPEDQTIKIARMAVETGMWVLYEVDHGRLRVTHRPSPLTPVKAYFQDQGRFSALSEQETEALQNMVEQHWRELEDS
ncbi:MAG: thiamine pyrophosphate-dependent enzyme, partial [Acidobacteriota bacterium]